MAEVTPKPPQLPTPPTDEEVRQVAEALGMSEDAARKIVGAAKLDGTETPDGQIITV